MALTLPQTLRTIHPRWPGFEPGYGERAGFAYDELSDTLDVSLDGAPRPAISVQHERDFDMLDVYLRVDAVTEEVVGFQIEGVSAEADPPAWVRAAMALAEDQDETGAARTAGSGQRVAAVDALFAALAPAPG